MIATTSSSSNGSPRTSRKSSLLTTRRIREGERIEEGDVVIEGGNVEHAASRSSRSLDALRGNQDHINPQVYEGQAYSTKADGSDTGSLADRLHMPPPPPPPSNPTTAPYHEPARPPHPYQEGISNADVSAFNKADTSNYVTPEDIALVTEAVIRQHKTVGLEGILHQVILIPSLPPHLHRMSIYPHLKECHQIRDISHHHHRQNILILALGLLLPQEWSN